jgi:hypothetical protein
MARRGRAGVDTPAFMISPPPGAQAEANRALTPHQRRGVHPGPYDLAPSGGSGSGPPAALAAASYRPGCKPRLRLHSPSRSSRASGGIV